MKAWEMMLAEELGAITPSGPPLIVELKEPFIGWTTRSIVIERVVRDHNDLPIGAHITLDSGYGQTIYIDHWMIGIDLALFDEQPSLFHTD